MNTKIKHLLSISVVTIFIIFAIASGDDKTKDTKDSTTENTVPKDTAKSNWDYYDDVDKMSSQKRYFATTHSTNKLNFPAPYDDEKISFDLTVRDLGKGSGDELTIDMNDGQFGVTETCRIKFDDNAPFDAYFTEADGAERPTIFLSDAKKIIAKMKKAKTMKVEIDFYGKGNDIVEFNVEGLKWDKK